MGKGKNTYSLILGCGGHKIGSLTTCRGTENVLIDFGRHIENLSRVEDFLDHQCQLFDRPIGDWNKVVNTVQLLHNSYNLIDDKLWQALQIWFPMHKRCGGYLRLVLNADLPKYLESFEEMVEPFKVL